MQTNPGNMFVPDAQPLPAAAVSLRLITADTYLPTEAFLVSVRDIFAKLKTHEFTITSLAGSNNDLNIIARDPGNTDITIEYRDPSANNAALSVTEHANFKTLLTGSNNDTVFTAVEEGAGGDDITIAFVDPAANNAIESVSVVGKAITFHLATGSGGAITSTPTTLKATLLASVAASALVTAVNAAGNDGSGAVTALSATALGGHAIIVHLATGSAGAISSTSADVSAAIQAKASTAALIYTENATSNTGAGVVIALAQTALGGPTGTSPTLDVTLKHDIDDATLPLVTSHSAFAQKTTATSEFKTFATVAPVGQWLLDLGGTSPVFAVSISVVFRPE
jgi:hypothetical protein